MCCSVILDVGCYSVIYNLAINIPLCTASIERLKKNIYLLIFSIFLARAWLQSYLCDVDVAARTRMACAGAGEAARARRRARASQEWSPRTAAARCCHLPRAHPALPGPRVRPVDLQPPLHSRLKELVHYNNTTYKRRSRFVFPRIILM